MHRGNSRSVIVYAAVMAAIVCASFLNLSVLEHESVIRFYQKIIFTVPVLFLIAAFLAFRIAETRIVLISFSFLVLSLSQQSVQLFSAVSPPETGNQPWVWFSSPALWRGFFEILPFVLPLSLGLIFILPDKIRRKSTMVFKIILLFLPLVCLPFQDIGIYPLLERFRYGRFLLPWPCIVVSMLPFAFSLFSPDRRSGAFSAALAATLLLFMLPMMMPLGVFLRDLCFLSAGIILLHSLYRIYWENSYIDELTGLYNRRALDEKFRRLKKDYSLSMVDVDHFKHFNDTYGHDEGDNVLRLVAKILRQHFGKNAYRYGGEEFCIIFMQTRADIAAEAMNDARADIERHMFSVRRVIKKRKKSDRKKTQKTVKKVKLTVSAGIASPVASAREAPDVLKNADKALYGAKERGRNRVEIHKGRK